jgi:surface-adhesin protein E
MKQRLFLITLLVLSSGPAYAAWVRGVTSEDAEVTVYIDPDIIRRKADLVKVWTLFDYTTTQTAVGKSWLSSKMHRQFDCSEERIRVLAFTMFSGNMGKGEPVYGNSDEGKWKPVAPGSIEQTRWKVACGN